MYQVSWAVNHGESKIEDFFLFMDTYEEVERWMGNIQDEDNIHHWTVSMVLEGSEPQHVEVYPEDEAERSTWQHNAVAVALEGSYLSQDVMDRGTQVMRAFALLPQRMSDPEIFATLMNIVSMYCDTTDEQQTMLRTCLASVDTVEEAKSNARRMMN